MQKRKVTCFTRDDDGKIQVLEDSDCGEKPEDSKECMMRPCEGVDWVTSEWSGVRNLFFIILIIIYTFAD